MWYVGVGDKTAELQRGTWPERNRCHLHVAPFILGVRLVIAHCGFLCGEAEIESVMTGL